MDYDPTTVPEATYSDWITVADPDDNESVYRFPVSFMLSGYECTYGRGCQGITGDPSLGCCAHGTHIGSDEDADFQRYDEKVRMALHLLPFKQQSMATNNGWWRLDPDEQVVRTRVVDGACIMHVPGQGCALHIEAVSRNEPPAEWKPIICTTYPLVVSENDELFPGVMVYDVAPLVEDWSGDENWWCIFDRESNWNGGRPAVLGLEEAISTATTPGVYERLVDRLREQYHEAFAAPHTRVEITKKK